MAVKSNVVLLNCAGSFIYPIIDVHLEYWPAAGLVRWSGVTAALPVWVLR